MDVTFRRTGGRRYGVFVQPVGYPPKEMNPAPGYDPAMPHDLVHYAVEETLGLAQGVFGQLAAGGTVGAFRIAPATPTRNAARLNRRIRQRGARLTREGSAEAGFSERAASVCLHAWLARSQAPEHRRAATDMVPYIRSLWASSSARDRGRLSPAAIQSVCDRLDELSGQWSRLDVGEGLTLHWPESRPARRAV